MTTTITAEHLPPTRPEAATCSVAWPAVAGLALVKIVFQLATATMYGFHRDEFYYLASGRHLSWGYVDQPPVVPALYRLGAALFGTSELGLHVVPALLGGVYVVVAALLCRDLGGAARAQVLTALVAFLGPLFLTTSHFLSTVSLDIVAWAVASHLLVRLVRTGNPRWWVAIGAVVGVGLLNKDTMGFWVLGAVGGLALTRPRVLANRWALMGGVTAVALVSPNLVWQIQHHWATLSFLHDLRAENGPTDMRQFVPLQLAMVTLAGTVVWVAGLRALVTDPDWRSGRWLAVGYLLCSVALFALGGKAYYLGSWYLPLVAVGAVVVERRWTPRAARALAAAVVVTGLATAPLFTPVLPEHEMAALGLDNANRDLGGMLGWPHVVSQISAQFHRLPPSQQAGAAILTANYSEAGAVDLWGPKLGLPRAVSGHNTYWWWGHPRATFSSAVIAVGLPRAFLTRYWGSVTQVATLGSDGALIDPQERGLPISLCTHQLVSWPSLWPAARHYG